MSFVGICFAYDLNGYYRTQWLCNATAFRLDAVYERGLDDEIANPYGVVSVESADDLPLDCELVVLSPRTARLIPGQESLEFFEHPERAIYLFGADTRFLSEEDLGGRRPDHIVYVPNISDDERDELYSFTIGAIVLYDRLMKLGRDG